MDDRVKTVIKSEKSTGEGVIEFKVEWIKIDEHSAGVRVAE